MFWVEFSLFDNMVQVGKSCYCQKFLNRGFQIDCKSYQSI